MGYDLMRSLGGGRPWVLMEQVTSQVNWRSHNVAETARPDAPVELSGGGARRRWGHVFPVAGQPSRGREVHGALVPHVGTSIPASGAR